MAKRIDGNQPAIVQALRDAGASVWCSHDVGHGFPDLVVGYHGMNYLIEVKQPHAALTPDESRWHAGWHGGVVVVYDAHEALRVIGQEMA